MQNPLPLVSLLLGTAPAEAAGYHLLKAEAIVGTAEEQVTEGGFGIYPVSDQLGFWMGFGDPDLKGNANGHRVRKWWVEGGWYGYQLGNPPGDLAELDLGNALERPWLFPYTRGRLGTDHTTRKRFTMDWSRHLVFSLPGLAKVQPRAVHFGPTLGLGLNLTWWEDYGDLTGNDVNTGMVRGEAGWVLGADWRDTLYAQGRTTLHYNLFGEHQTNLGVAGVMGVFLGRLGKPFGFEVKGEYDRGDDNVAGQPGDVWSLRGVLFVKAPIPRDEPSTDDTARLLEMLEDLEDRRRDEEAAEQVDSAERRRQAERAIRKKSGNARAALDEPLPSDAASEPGAGGVPEQAPPSGEWPAPGPPSEVGDPPATGDATAPGAQSPTEAPPETEGNGATEEAGEADAPAEATDPPASEDPRPGPRPVGPEP